MTITLATLAQQLADAQARRDTLIGPIDEEIDSLKAAIRQQLAEQGPGTYTAGDHTVTLRANRRFDAAYAAEHLPPALLETITTTTVDSSLAKKRLSPEMYEACMTERGAQVVTVK